MSGFFSYIFDRWYIAVILAVLIALTVFAWIKAIASGQKRREERDRIIAQLEYEKELRAQFKELDKKMFEPGEVDDERLLFGVAMNIQMSIEKKDDMTGEFNNLSEIKKNAYAMNFVIEDSRCEKLSEFFRSNGEPLTAQAQTAVKTFIGGEISDIFDEMYAMMSEDNEEVSFDSERVNTLDERFKSIFDSDKNNIMKSIADSLRVSADDFFN